MIPFGAMKGTGLPDSLAGKESACNAGDPGLIPGLGRSTGEGIGYPLQCSGLENSMDCIVHGVAESAMAEVLSLSLCFCLEESRNLRFRAAPKPSVLAFLP